MHSRGVVHRDVKAVSLTYFVTISFQLSVAFKANLLLDWSASEGTLTGALTDFGSRKMLNSVQNFDSSDTYAPAWQPPEYVSDKSAFHDDYTTYGDMWSFGCTFLEVRRALSLACLDLLIAHCPLERPLAPDYARKTALERNPEEACETKDY